MLLPGAVPLKRALGHSNLNHVDMINTINCCGEILTCFRYSLHFLSQVSETGTTRQSSSGAGGRGSAIGPKRREQNRLAQAAFRERKKQSQQAIQEELEELRANCDKFKEASQRLQRELDAARTVLEEIGGEEALARAAKLATKNPRMGGSSTRGRSAASASTPRVTSSKAVDAIEVDSSSSSVRRSTRGGHSMQYQSVHTSDPPPIGGLVGFTAEQDGISVLDSGGRAKRRR